MSLGRTITKKRSRYGFGSSSSLDEDSRRYSVSKHQISAPVVLLSTTNMLSYTAPSLRTSLSQGSISSGSSSSGSPTLRSPLSPSFADDAVRCDLPLPTNHLSAYFASPDQLPPSRSQSTRDAPKASLAAGRRPRHPSMPPPPTSSAQPPRELHSAARASGHHQYHHHNHNHSHHSHHHQQQQHQQHSPLPLQHPFGAELAQVAEMTEEIAGLSVSDAEEQFMRSRGLQRFRASDYEQEIWLGMGGVFEDQLPSFGAGWI